MGNAGQLGGHVTSEIFPVEHTPIMARTWTHEGDDVTHDHTFTEIAVVLSGTAVHRTIYGDQRIGAGDAFVLVPGAWHAYVRSEHLLIYNLLLGPELVQRELAWTKEDPLMSHLLWTGPVEPDRRGVLRLSIPRGSLRQARVLLDAIAQSTRPESTSNRADQLGRLLLFLSHLADHLGPGPHADTPRLRRQHPAVSRGIRLLEEGLSQSWSLSRLSEELQLDSSYLVRLFKAQTGLTPIAYLARARAEHAAVMLLRTDLPVGDIGAAVGWSDANYFARRFKAHFRLTASEYRSRSASGKLQPPPIPR